MSSLGTLTLDLVAEVGRFTQGLDQASRIADRNSKEIQRNLQSIDNKIAAMTGNIKTFAGVLGIGLSANAFGGWIDGAMQAAADTAVFANRVDVSVESLTAMRYVASQVGVSMDSFDASVMRLTRRLGAATNEGGPAITTLKRLGLSAEELLRLPLEDRIKMIGKSMEKLGTQAERLTAAQDLAGDSARALVPLFVMGSDAIDEQMEKARKLGYVYSAEFASSADFIIGQMDDVKGAFNNLSIYLAGEFIPTISGILSGITPDDIENYIEKAKIGFDVLGVGAKILAGIIFGRLTSATVASGIAFRASTKEALRYQMALARMEGRSERAAKGLLVLSSATRGASAAMGLLGGPVGMAAIAMSAIIALNIPAKNAADNIEELDSKLMGLNQRASSMTKHQAEKAIADLTPDLDQLKERHANLVNELTEVSEHWLVKSKKILDDAIAKGTSTDQHIAHLEKVHSQWIVKVRDQRDEIDTLNQKIEETSDALNLVTERAEIAGDAVALAAKRGTKQFDEYVTSILDRTALLGVTTEHGKLMHDIEMGRYDDLSEEQRKELEFYAKQYDAKQRSLRVSKSGVNIAEEYKRIMQSTLSDEERRGQELAKNLGILQQYGASEEEILAVRRAAYESMSTDIPGMGEGGNTLTAQLARIGENMAQLDAWREEQLMKLELAYGGEESALAESLERREELEQQYRERRQQFEGEMNQELLNLGVNLSNDSLDALRQAGMESSGIYKAMFLTNKAASFANAVISANEAGAKAMAAYPDPIMGMSVGAMVKGIGLANAGVIAATGLKGMAHSGLDKVPETGTWLLEKGERVVTANTSAKLDATLENLRKKQITDSKGGGGNVYSTVNVTLNSSGEVESQSEMGGKALGNLIKEKTIEVIIEQHATGGIFARR